MRIMFLAVTTATAAIAFSAPATAQQAALYPWCAQYEEGGTNCGFASLSQCQQALSGNGGFCDQNQNIPAGPLATSSIPPGPSERTTTGSAPPRTERQRVSR